MWHCWTFWYNSRPHNKGRRDVLPGTEMTNSSWLLCEASLQFTDPPLRFHDRKIPSDFKASFSLESRWRRTELSDLTELKPICSQNRPSKLIRLCFWWTDRRFLTLPQIFLGRSLGRRNISAKLMRGDVNKKAFIPSPQESWRLSFGDLTQRP